MKHLIFILSLFLVIVVNPCQAQVPGFIGKKFIVSGGLLFFPAHHPTYHNRENTNFISKMIDAIVGEKDFFPIYGINYTKTLGLDYTVARNITLGMNYQNMRSSDFTTVEKTDSSGNSYYSKDIIRYVYGNSIGANIKFFNEGKGALAPIGNFQKLGLSILFTKSYDTLDNIAKLAPTKNHFLTFTYGFGRTVIFQKSFTFTYGVDMTLMFDRNMGGLIDQSDPRRYTDASFYRLRKMQFFNAYTSIGYIF